MSEFISFLIIGIVTGAVYAVSASGLVVTYNTTGIFNFAHGALGMLMAFLFWQFWQGWGWNPLLSLLLVLLVAAPLLGAFLEFAIMRPLYGAPTGITVAVTIGLLLFVYGIATTIWNPVNTYILPPFFNGSQIAIGSVNVSGEQLLTVGLAVGVAIFFRIFFKRTRTGIAMRGIVDDPDLARLSGAPSRRIASLAWMIGVALAGIAGILDSPGTTMNALILTELVIVGYAAAVVGRLRSLPLTFLGAMVLGIANSMVIGYVSQSILTYVTAALPMAMLFLVLLIMPEARLAIGRVARMRPPRVPSFQKTLVGGAVLIVLAVIGSYLFTGANLGTFGDIFGIGLLALSLIPLSGYGGQVSLCQLTFAGVGALTMSWIGGGSSVLGLLAAMGLCGAMGALLALPALRLRGIYLALATLAFAVLMDNVFFNTPAIVGQGGLISVGRPDILGMHFASERSYVIFLAVVLAIFLVLVGVIRRGRFGRRLVALQDSPVASTTLGAGLAVTKLAVFTGSAALAGLAGALWTGLGGTASPEQFTFLESLVLFSAVTLAGSRMLTSAVLAGVTLAVAPVIGDHISWLQNFTYLLVGLGIMSIGRNPNAMGTVFNIAGDWWQNRRKTKMTGGVAPSDIPSTPGVEVPSLG